MDKQLLPPIHPGEILLEEFLEPLELSQYKLAKDISVPPRRINEIVQGKRAITPDTSLRLSRYFGLSERFWLNLQNRYDLETTKDRLAGRLQDEVRILSAAQNRSTATAARVTLFFNCRRQCRSSRLQQFAALGAQRQYRDQTGLAGDAASLTRFGFDTPPTAGATQPPLVSRCWTTTPAPADPTDRAHHPPANSS